MQTEEDHPFKLYAPPGCRMLLIGTFPPTKKNWSYEFFYPNKQNLFWTIMASIAGVALQYFSGVSAVEERKRILQTLGVAITDMGLKINRTRESSLDEDLIAVEYMDILEILDRYPRINKILFTSSSGKASAAQWFVNYLQKQNILHRFPKGLKPLKSQFEYKGRMIELVVLYSPSRRAANRITLANLTEMYRREIRPE